MSNHLFNPKVSIIIPVYNGANYLAEAINSALDQTYNNLEILVINDGSNDNNASENIALNYGDKIKYFKKANGGVASALNHGIAQMSGDYFSWLSHDDLYTPDKVAKQIKALNLENSKSTIIYSDFAQFSTDPNVCNEIKLHTVPPNAFRYWLTEKSSLHGCTLLIPKSAFAKAGYFDLSKRTTQDYDMWFRLGQYCNFIHLPEVLVKARTHPEQGTVTLNSTVIKEGDQLIKSFISLLDTKDLLATNKSAALAYAQLAGSAYNRGFFDAYQTSFMLMKKNISSIKISEVPNLLYSLIIGKLKFLLKAKFRKINLHKP